jgi:large subunit ribosomal protein L10
MPNRINKAIVSEYTDKFGEAPDMVAVDINGLTVAEFEELRNQARDKDIEVFVVRTALARLTLKESLAENGVENVVTGPTAILMGGDGLPSVARLANDFGKKTGKLTVRGGIFDKAVIGIEDVDRFKDIPDRQTLLGQVLATIVAPLTGVVGVANALLRAPAALADALVEKQGGVPEE